MDFQPFHDNNVKVPTKHIICIEDITINKELGKGQFGVVQQGTWTTGNQRVRVYISTSFSTYKHHKNTLVHIHVFIIIIWKCEGWHELFPRLWTYMWYGIAKRIVNHLVTRCAFCKAQYSKGLHTSTIPFYLKIILFSETSFSDNSFSWIYFKIQSLNVWCLLVLIIPHINVKCHCCQCNLINANFAKHPLFSAFSYWLVCMQWRHEYSCVYCLHNVWNVN